MRSTVFSIAKHVGSSESDAVSIYSSFCLPWSLHSIIDGDKDHITLYLYRVNNMESDVFSHASC